MRGLVLLPETVGVADPTMTVISETKPEPRHGSGFMGREELFDVIRSPRDSATAVLVDLLYREDISVLGISAFRPPLVGCSKRLDASVGGRSPTAKAILDVDESFFREICVERSHAVAVGIDRLAGLLQPSLAPAQRERRKLLCSYLFLHPHDKCLAQRVKGALLGALRLLSLKSLSSSSRIVVLMEARLSWPNRDRDELVRITFHPNTPPESPGCRVVLFQPLELELHRCAPPHFFGSFTLGSEGSEFAAVFNCSERNSSLRLPSGWTTIAVGVRPAAVAAAIALETEAFVSFGAGID
ncbi:hypothetical protein ACEWPM_015810 [Roseovarius sp. S4756]|uniref:hypothetical protein n=1 Tax=Roseovarius maritimus TaxID=3342637 RepID=UPI00372C7C40